MKGLLFIGAIILCSGCATIKKQAWKAEIKYVQEWRTEKLEEALLKSIEKGDLTEKQAEKVREGAYWLLDKIIERAENKLKAQEEEK